jgi:hypothetical protein
MVLRTRTSTGTAILIGLCFLCVPPSFTADIGSELHFSFEILQPSDRNANPRYVCQNFTRNVIFESLHPRTSSDMSFPSKDRYFENLRSLSHSDITKTPLTDSNLRLRGMMTGNFNEQEEPKVMFVGNSIAREISQRYAHISSTKDNFRVINWWVDAMEKEESSLESLIKTEHVDILFITGPNLHHLQRFQDETGKKDGPIKSPLQILGAQLNSDNNNNNAGKNKANKAAATATAISNLLSPHMQHAKLVRSVFSMLSELSQQTNTFIAYIGMIDLDQEVMFLEPMKQNWPNYYELSFSSIWVDTEKNVFENEFRKTNSTFAYFDVSELSRMCPGIRCDGMHFHASGYHGSSTTRERGSIRKGGPVDWKCTPSNALWDQFLADFLVKAFPSAT